MIYYLSKRRHPTQKNSVLLGYHPQESVRPDPGLRRSLLNSDRTREAGGKA